MSLTYGVICITALILLCVCVIVDREKDIWLRLLFLSIFVANLGYFLLSTSKTLTRPHRFEFLSITYILTESLILVLYSAFQKHNIKRRVICVWTLVFAGAGIALACKFVLPKDPEYYLFSLIRSFIYMGMYYVWGRSVCHGIIQKVPRRCFGWVSMLLVFWIAVSMCKHLVFASNVTIVRYLWYAYYIPQILIAVLGLNIAIMAGGGENVRLGKGGMLLFGAGAALIVLVLTNDLHQIVFSFPGGVPWTNASCTHEAGYYLIMGLIALSGIAISAMIVHKCRIPRRKKFTPLPFLCVSVIILYAILYFVEGSFVHEYHL